MPVEKVQAFEAAFHKFMESNKPEIAAKIMDEKAISDAIADTLKQALTDFKNTVPY